MDAEWKKRVLAEMGIEDYVELGLGEIILLLVALGGKPLQGLESLHLMLFLYPYVDSGEKLLFAAPYSAKVERELLRLEREGLVTRRSGHRNGRLTVSLVATQRGAERAKMLASKLRRSYVVFRGFAVRRGVEVLEELESLKKVYNGLGFLDVGVRIASLILSGDERVLSRFSSEELPALRIYAKALLEELKRLRRQ